MAGTESRYRVLRKLGAGGMGEVFLAEDRSLRRQVALKKLAPARLNEDSRRILLHEARAIARVNHPSIAAIHDVVEEPDGSYLVMEYVPGQTLAERIKEGPLAPAEVVRISRQIADALAAVHALPPILTDARCELQIRVRMNGRPCLPADHIKLRHGCSPARPTHSSSNGSTVGDRRSCDRATKRSLDGKEEWGRESRRHD